MELVSPRARQNLARQIVDYGHFMEFAESDCGVYGFNFRKFLEKLIPFDLKNKKTFIFELKVEPVLRDQV